MFYEDDEILAMETSLLEQAHFKAMYLTNTHAKRYLDEGFMRRHLMMQSSRIYIRENTKPSRGEALDPYLTTALSIHVNAYYLNLRGSLDNLAWCLLYHFKINSKVTEEGRLRSYCDLFNEKFLDDLRVINESLVATLRERIDWNRDLKAFRDPAAHRIPLYVAPGFLSETTLDQYRKIEAHASKSKEEMGGLPRSHFLEKARKLATYYPIMISSPATGLQSHSILEQRKRPLMPTVGLA